MTTIQFYHLLHTPLEQALPALMQKTLKAGFRSVILTESEQAMRALDAALWAEERRFVPHGTKADLHAGKQPIYVTDQVENPNDARLLVNVSGAEPASFDGYERVLDLFNGRDETALNQARARWKTYKDQGHSLTYIQQQKGGGWKEMTKT